MDKTTAIVDFPASMSEMNQYYELLGLQPGASQAEVKQAYRELAKVWHPDRYTQDAHQQRQAEEKLKQLNEAYQRLKDYQPPPSSRATTPRSTPKAPPKTSHAKPHISSRPASADTYYYRGAENAKAGRYKEALEDFSTAIRVNPNYAEAYRYRGFVHSMLGFELGADADLKKAKQLELEQQVRSTPSPSNRREPFQQQFSRSPSSPVSYTHL
ncbi:J domain-containing protein, partial [Pantanalinema rosaneae CENA516]|uniref:J domain-containing protein n=1 Tax=Pantanalinema rosaneae TaxID=1620701 RepID=UPI003D6EB18C